MSAWLDKLSQTFQTEPTNSDHLQQILRDACEREIIDKESLSMLEGVLSVSELRVKDAMIPRAQMVFVEQKQTPEQFLPIIVNAAHSRFPVIGDNPDDIVGILLAKDLLKHFILHPDAPLTLSDDLLRAPVFVPESKRLDAMLREFRSSHNHMAIVIDEYGGIAGMVTIEDVLEEIVGDIEDEFDTEGTQHIQRIGERTYHIHAHTQIEDFNAAFHTTFSDDKVDSMGGLIMLTLERLPHVNETIELDGLTFTVTKVDKRRIYQLELKLPAGWECDV